MNRSKPVSLWHLGRLFLAMAAMAGVFLTPGCSPANTPTPPPTPTLKPTATILPTATPKPTARPVELTILHTNDVVGYTEPCG